MKHEKPLCVPGKLYNCIKESKRIEVHIIDVGQTFVNAFYYSENHKKDLISYTPVPDRTNYLGTTSWATRPHQVDSVTTNKKERTKISAIIAK